MDRKTFMQVNKDNDRSVIRLLHLLETVWKGRFDLPRKRFHTIFVAFNEVSFSSYFKPLYIQSLIRSCKQRDHSCLRAYAGSAAGKEAADVLSYRDPTRERPPRSAINLAVEINGSQL